MFQLVGLLLFVTTTLVSAYPGGVSTIQLTDPSLASIYSPASTQVVAGKQLFVKTTAYRPSSYFSYYDHVYNDTEPLPFIAIIETRDNGGTTQSIAFQSVSLKANEQASIGTSWIPPEPGMHYLRAFAITELGENSMILSTPVQSTVTVV